jgi:hypothetical protein
MEEDGLMRRCLTITFKLCASDHADATLGLNSIHTYSGDKKELIDAVLHRLRGMLEREIPEDKRMKVLYGYEWK